MPAQQKTPAEPFTTMTVSAPAKINLYLRALRRRADGYHELSSWMQKIALCDYLTITPRATPRIRLEVRNQNLAADATNLVWRAAAAFFAACDARAANRGGVNGLDILLEKHIPTAAGLGGGSSDAATTLASLNQICGAPLDADTLANIGLSLGADVPFFLFAAPAAYAGGIGEILRAAPTLDGYHIVLVNPGFAVSTKEVFSRLSLTSPRKKTTKSGPGAGGSQPLTELENDLEAVTIAMRPEIARIKNRLIALGAARALMSGSGATVFALFSHRDFPDAPTTMAEDLRREFGSLVFVTHALTGA
ncbi:MAG: 4-(cytidine 5'-diphospho)-2-C-methyl-D-erythritol kinase [Desulfobulbaceae bacterium]|jgi:4-diphosphocytidyl-2-C-methyl-D-erythritol kinase|nr:4-(cytidine 5'-diphospho)-2-C-methyl-D-erythritol kinase [Desulfobulbaceae bacterium]